MCEASFRPTHLTSEIQQPPEHTIHRLYFVLATFKMPVRRPLLPRQQNSKICICKYFALSSHYCLAFVVTSYPLCTLHDVLNCPDPMFSE